VLLGVTTYLVSVNQQLNFLEQRESVALTLQVAVALGGLLSLLGAADAISGERERGTLEGLLLTPVPRRSLVVGKAVGALSLWFGAYVVSLPYLWFLGHDVGVAGSAAATGLLVGSLLAVSLVGLGLLLSFFAGSNKVSLAVGLFVLLALFAPTQMPSSAQHGWFGTALLHIDPVTSGLTLLGRIVIDGHSLADELGWLVGPLLAAAATMTAVLALAPRLSLRPGAGS
jgi:ABC-2 type transport system permease protein